MKYKFSDIVKAYDRDEKGVISFVYGQITNKPYSVNFESGYSDNYAEEDLQPWEEKPVHPEKSDPVEHPSHYMCHEMECIDEMELLFGITATMIFCKLCAWKYRYRAGSKGSAEEDQKKADWYINKYKELDDYGKLPELYELLSKLSDIKHSHKHAIEKASIYECMNAVRDMPSYNNPWIPVEERLPEERDTVLISTDTGTYAGIYFCDEWYGENMYCYDSMLRKTGVIAWMPMPEPYKPE